MRVSKWGNSLAARFLKMLMEALKGRFTADKIDKRAEFLRQMDQFHFPLPEGYKFNRDEANQR